MYQRSKQMVWRYCGAKACESVWVPVYLEIQQELVLSKLYGILSAKNQNIQYILYYISIFYSNYSVITTGSIG